MILNKKKKKKTYKINDFIKVYFDNFVLYLL
jgi:hypothetical protein